MPIQKLQLKENKPTELKSISVNHLDVPDEWDTVYTCELFQKHRRVMVRAEYAGSGKSYACEYMRKLGHKVVFVCPTNLLKQDIGGEAVTLNTFFSVTMPGKGAEPLPKFDDSQFDVIVFDEIFFADIRMLGRIKRYSESIKSRKQ